MRRLAIPAVALSALALVVALATPAHAVTTDEVRRALLGETEALRATGLPGPIRQGTDGCRTNTLFTGCSREWTGDNAANPIPTGTSVAAYRRVGEARNAIIDIKQDAPPNVVRFGPRLLIAYYETRAGGVEAYGWRRIGNVVIRVGCVGQPAKRAATIACVEDLLPAQSALVREQGLPD